MWASSWPMILWSLCGAGWLLLLGRLRHAWPATLAAVLALATLPLVADETRVGVVILFPALAYWVFFNREFWRPCPLPLVVGAVVLYLLAPPVYVWGGVVCGSVREHTIAQVHVQPRVSRWTALDFFWPFVDGVCPRPDLP